MHYTILIYEGADSLAARTDPKQQAEYWALWPPYTQALKAAGIFVGGAGLQPPATATTVRMQDGRNLVQDGPYADTKEQLGGFFMIDVPDLDTALAWASRCPRLGSNVVEVRPNLPPNYAQAKAGHTVAEAEA